MNSIIKRIHLLKLQQNFIKVPNLIKFQIKMCVFCIFNFVVYIVTTFIKIIILSNLFLLLFLNKRISFISLWIF